MKVKKLRYLLARRSFHFCTFGPALSLFVILLFRYPPQVSLLRLPSYLFGLAASILAFTALAWLGGFLLLWPIVARIVSRFNGAPYQIGDVVCILTGPNRDRIAPVYEIWDDYGQVRVELGDLEKNELEDIFAYFQVCRE